MTPHWAWRGKREKRIFGFAPLNWAFCNGQQALILRNQVLYSIIGAQFRGDNRTYLKLPNRMGRTPMQ